MLFTDILFFIVSKCVYYIMYLSCRKRWVERQVSIFYRRASEGMLFISIQHWCSAVENYRLTLDARRSYRSSGLYAFESEWYGTQKVVCTVYPMSSSNFLTEFPASMYCQYLLQKSFTQCALSLRLAKIYNVFLQLFRGIELVFIV